MFKAQIDAFIMGSTGLLPGPDPDGKQSTPAPPPSSETTDGSGKSPATVVGPSLAPSMLDSDLQNQIVTLAFGTKLAQRRNPDND